MLNEKFSPPSSKLNNNHKRIIDDSSNVERLWENHVSSQPNKKPCKSKLKIYLEKRLMVDENKFILLTWWNPKSSKFPTLFSLMNFFVKLYSMDYLV